MKSFKEIILLSYNYLINLLKLFILEFIFLNFQFKRHFHLFICFHFIFKFRFHFNFHFHFNFSFHFILFNLLYFHHWNLLQNYILINYWPTFIISFNVFLNIPDFYIKIVIYFIQFLLILYQIKLGLIQFRNYQSIQNHGINSPCFLPDFNFIIHLIFLINLTDHFIIYLIQYYHVVNSNKSYQKTPTHYFQIFIISKNNQILKITLFNYFMK